MGTSYNSYSYGSKGSIIPNREEAYPISEQHVAYSKNIPLSKGAEMQEILNLFKDYEDAKLELSEISREYEKAKENVEITKRNLYNKLDSLTKEQKEAFEKLLDIPNKDDRDER